MAWVILEGLDRTGKSSVAELYKRQGYEVVHMSAPNKKYVQPGYSGPSYLDELLDIYMKYSAKDVIFDRSPYGEFVWPFVYGRKSQLTEEDLEVLQDLEAQNDTQRILMYDSLVEAHWKRCVDNNEPLTRQQFNQANLLFDKMARKFSFEKKQLSDFEPLQKAVIAGAPQPKEQPLVTVSETVQVGELSKTTSVTTTSSELAKLEKANAINDVLSKRILKQKGPIFESLEKDIRDFLTDKLSTIFGSDTKASLTDEEVQILKLYCKQLKLKLEAKR